MISEKMMGLVRNNSAIRAMFEEGKGGGVVTAVRMSMISAWGTPTIGASRTEKGLSSTYSARRTRYIVHGYMSNTGYEAVRSAVAIR